MPEITSEPRTAGRIVVGYDGSDAAQDALAHAASMAHQRGEELLVVMAMPHLSPSHPQTMRAIRMDPSYIINVRSRARSRLEQVENWLRENYPDVDSSSVIVPEDPAGVLAKASEDAAMVVVGARGRGGGQRPPVLGQVSSAVVQHSHGPVMVVPAGAPLGNDGPVVVGIQDAPESLAAARLAIHEAEILGVPLVAIYAWDLAPEMGEYGAPIITDTEKIETELDDMLAEILKPIIADHPDVEVKRLVLRGPARQVLADASESASLLVVGSRGLGGFRGLLLGSTSRALTRTARCPVIVVRR